MISADVTPLNVNRRRRDDLIVLSRGYPVERQEVKNVPMDRYIFPSPLK